MYPDGRTNPKPAHFAKNKSVEAHVPVSSRLLRQRNLDREGRAICRIVYAHDIRVELIARVFCVSEETVIQALENKPGTEEHDKAEHDYWYVSSEYQKEYPALEKSGKVPCFRINDTVLRPKLLSAQSKKTNIVQPKAVNAHPKSNSLKEPKASMSDKQTASSSLTTTPQKSRNSQLPNRISTDFSNRDVQTASSWLKNPTCRHFRKDVPVVQNVSASSSSGHGLKLDRKGRAICRIVHPYFQNYTKIAYIFGIAHTRIRRAVLNEYMCPDDVTEDYQHAGKEFEHEYPQLSDDESESQSEGFNQRGISLEIDKIPKQPEACLEATTKSTNTMPRRQVELSPRPRPGQSESDPPKVQKRPRSPEMNTVSPKRTKQDETSNRGAKVNQKAAHAESSPRTTVDSASVPVRNFLQNIGGFDLSRWQETLSKKGLGTMDDLTTLASLEESRLVKTLTRLFADQQMPEVHVLLLADALADLARHGS
ncbi:hypothetical protein DFH07DRAFT_980821 [Mycena maculata]|uniref:Uncharacterized protein n=1 Tax=Mycena maculata TaxID=230809 RepID=A0AAD7K251_9AGAR|nr:hypothetical protein DFH07DRAFT_980821 [Mycena maculata]